MRFIPALAVTSLLLAACSTTPSTQDPQTFGELDASTISSGWEHDDTPVARSATLPIAAERGLTSAGELQVDAPLTLDLNASAYAAQGFSLHTTQLTLNGNRVQAATGSHHCQDQSGLGLCTNGTATLLIPALKTALAPDTHALRQANTPAQYATTISGSLTVKTPAQLSALLAAGPVHVLGNLNVLVPAILTGTLVVEKELNFKGAVTLQGGKVLGRDVRFQNGLSLTGGSLVLAQKDLKLRGALSGQNERPAQLIAGKDLEVQGVGGELGAVLWAGDNLHLQAPLHVTGGLLAGEELQVHAPLTVSVRTPMDRLAERLGGDAALAAFLLGSDTSAIAAQLQEYGLNFLVEPATPIAALNLTAQGALDCADSTPTQPRITSAAGTTVRPAGNGGAYTIDSLGRPYQGLITLPPVNPTTRTSAVSSCSAAVGKIDGATDTQGGHILGLQYGGWGLRANLAPQNSSFNTGNWAQLEGQIALCGNLIGKTATVKVTLVYARSAGEQNTPNTWTPSITVGSAAAITGTFKNTAADSGTGATAGTTLRTSLVSQLSAAGCR